MRMPALRDGRHAIRQRRAIIARADSPCRPQRSGPDDPMPITLLDLVLLAVMLMSGLLAMVRGFMREVLSIAAWGAAALVTLYVLSRSFCRPRKTYFNNDTVATVVVIAGLFHRHADHRLDHHGADFRHDPGLPDRRARPHARVPVRARPRPADRGGRLPVLQLAGSGQAAPGLGPHGQIAQACCKEPGIG